MLSFETANGWEILNLEDMSKTDVLINPSENAIEDGLQGFNCGPDDLCVIHHPVIGNTGVFKFVDQLIAKRFDLPTRTVAVKYSQTRQALFKRNQERSVDGNEGLKPVTVRHDVISRSEWLNHRAKAAVAA